MIFSCNNRIGNFFRVKDTIPKLWRSHVVYKINCEACNASYIGKTINTLYERFHVGKTTAHLHPENAISPLNKHLRQFPSHSFDDENIQIIDTSITDEMLLIKESLYITHDKPKLNGILELSQFICFYFYLWFHAFILYYILYHLTILILIYLFLAQTIS